MLAGEERDVAKHDPVKMLAAVPLFSELSKKDLEALARSAKEVHHPADAVLAREGEAGLGFFLIVDGKATVTVNGRTRARMGGKRDAKSGLRTSRMIPTRGAVTWRRSGSIRGSGRLSTQK